MLCWEQVLVHQGKVITWSSSNLKLLGHKFIPYMCNFYHAPKSCEHPYQQHSLVLRTAAKSSRSQIIQVTMPASLTLKSGKTVLQTKKKWPICPAGNCQCHSWARHGRAELWSCLSGQRYFDFLCFLLRFLFQMHIVSCMIMCQASVCSQKEDEYLSMEIFCLWKTSFKKELQQLFVISNEGISWKAYLQVGNEFYLS